MKAKKLGIALLAAAAAIAPSQLSAQNIHTSQLYEQIIENIRITIPGFVLDSFGIVRLTPDSSSRISLDLPSGREIEVMGDCDDDCFDLDLVIRDGNGETITEDRAADYYPIVKFVSDDSGRIDIELIMHDCDANYCYAAYSVFIGPDS